MTGGHCSEVDLVLKLLGQDLRWSLLTGGRYSEVVVSTGLTVLLFHAHFQNTQILHIESTVKPVYKDHPRDPKFVAVVDKWSLFRGRFGL